MTANDIRATRPGPRTAAELKDRLNELSATAESRIPPVLPIGASAAALTWMTDEEVNERHEIVLALTRLEGDSAADAAARIASKHAALARKRGTTNATAPLGGSRVAEPGGSQARAVAPEIESPA